MSWEGGEGGGAKSRMVQMITPHLYCSDASQRVLLGGRVPVHGGTKVVGTWILD